jgi:hypothetical protein
MHRCETGLPWLMEPVPGQVRRVYLCGCGLTLADPQAPAGWDIVAAQVVAVTQRIQTHADNAAAEWRVSRGTQ